jgi:hypothetical protein
VRKRRRRGRCILRNRRRRGRCLVRNRPRRGRCILRNRRRRGRCGAGARESCPRRRPRTRTNRTWPLAWCRRRWSTAVGSSGDDPTGWHPRRRRNPGRGQGGRRAPPPSVRRGGTGAGRSPVPAMGRSWERERERERERGWSPVVGRRSDVVDQREEPPVRVRGRYYMYICNCMRVPNDENDEKKGWRAIAIELTASIASIDASARRRTCWW